ncbi:MAG TPA: chromate efflux transporter [Acetobacteraceae bacterium]|nr:chromate efflux transporter [Acetobacteraceae bacterium]
MTGTLTTSAARHGLPQPAGRGTTREVLLAFLRLGLTAFGGPIAHLGYFRAEFVERRHWLDEAAYADIVALCQVLPGPSSSQVGLLLGFRRAGLAGALAAWIGFTLPSAAAMIGFGAWMARFGAAGHAPWLHGLKLVAVAIVAQAVWGMARALCPDRERASVAVGAVLLTLALPPQAGQLAAIALGAVAGWLVLPREAAQPGLGAVAGSGRALAALIAYAVLLVLLPALAAALGSHALALAGAFYRAGALVFGGGHVVLPLLHDAVVPTGWVREGDFLAGYGAVQAVPGPLFTFAAYLGAVAAPAPRGWAGGLLCLAAIYLPSVLLLAGALPFWNALRHHAGVRAALAGVNAAVVGLLASALYAPVWTGSVHGGADFGLVLTAFLLLTGWRMPPWLVVLGGALAAAVLG